MPRPCRSLPAAVPPKAHGGPFKDDVRVVAAPNGIATIAPHFAAQSLIEAMIEAGMASTAFEDAYTAAAIAALLDDRS